MAVGPNRFAAASRLAFFRVGATPPSSPPQSAPPRTATAPPGSSFRRLLWPPGQGRARRQESAYSVRFWLSMQERAVFDGPPLLLRLKTLFQSSAPNLLTSTDDPRSTIGQRKGVV